MLSTRLATSADGRPVVIKEADAAAAEGLRREAEVLAAARHPGVVELEGAGPVEEGGFRVVLRWAGSRTGGDVRLDPVAAATLAAALAETVADLHGLGIRHGRIRPEHVLVDATGRPVLCGFSGARRGDEPDAAAEAADVRGVGEVLRALVGPDTELEPIPVHRFGRRRPWAGADRRALLTLADQATHDDPARRPGARQLAAQLAATVPAPDAAAGDRAGGVLRRVPWRLLAGAVGLGLVASGLSALRSPSSPPGSPTSPASPAPAASSGPAPARSDEPASAAPMRPGCAAVATPAADHDGDGCESTVTIDGAVVAIDRTRYRVGEPGDVAAVGDWDCDGAATVATVRPATGEVFVFDRWATPGADVAVDAVATVAGARRPEAEPAEGGCARLVVVGASGERTAVAVP